MFITAGIGSKAGFTLNGTDIVGTIHAIDYAVVTLDLGNGILASVPRGELFAVTDDYTGNHRTDF